MLRYKGGGLLNKLINKLPFEAHIPGYQYCGPGTKLQKKLERGVSGINKLDDFCKFHDIAYDTYTDINKRHEADKILAEQAWSRVKSKDATWREKAAAWAVTNIMKGKVKTGSGLKTKKKTNVETKKGGKLLIGKKKIEKSKKKSKRIIPTRKIGGALPLALIPVIAGAVTAVLGGVKTVNDIRNSKKALEETIRHNKKLEESAVKGRGFYLRPYQKKKKP
ncbi:uncharacterized protein LOC123296571 [Chrysoperla carnea]|uniref:uncharacterized protein LOC123296478 n=1 Tax=Chrysoperla carnea TaxID=189513 RepID=UPI001D0852C5|nr:uncharacterized protein LOC123296478 [Chrysoperla carnea]XP_044734036.1 uncharacterized protein LOC123296571 [Chrysoperla carnea]